MIAASNIYLTADRREVVCEGDRRSAFLLVGKGQEISRELQLAYNLRDLSAALPVAAPTASEREIEERKTRIPRVLRTRDIKRG